MTVTDHQVTEPTSWPESMDRPRHAVVDLFAGIGCVARGFRSGGPFDPAYLSDIDPVAERAYLDNPIEGAVYQRKDIADVEARGIRQACDGRQLVGLLGCPPCQGWSAAGTRKANDPRNALMGNFFELVRTLSPTFVLMENVPAVAGRPELRSALSDAGSEYRWWTGVLNAAAYGLPQTRQRTLIIGYHRSTGVTPTAPLPTHAGARAVWDYSREQLVTPSPSTIDSLLGSAPRLYAAGRHSMLDIYGETDLASLTDLVTVSEAIGDLYKGDPPSAYATALGAESGVIPTGHTPWRHSKEMVARLRRVGEGKRPRPKCPDSAPPYFSQAYTRLHSRGLARTVTTNFHNPGSGRFTHYRAHRVITPREAARIQGIPDSFRLSGQLEQMERLIGNAFPPPWARAIARHVSCELREVLASL